VSRRIAARRKDLSTPEMRLLVTTTMMLPAIVNAIQRITRNE
jgi:hypothetical protein